jgi:predicted membrane-bound spermidine synthase
MSYFWALLGSGYLSLSAEILAIRLHTPYFGGGTTQTSLIIGVVLVALALGSWLSTRIKEAQRVLPLALIGVALWGAWVLTQPTLAWLYADKATVLPTWSWKMVTGLCVTLAPLGLLHGLNTSLLMRPSQGRHLGVALAINTLGAFLGSVLTSLLLQSFLSATQMVLLNTVLALGLCLMMRVQNKIILTLFLGLLIASVPFNLGWSKRSGVYESGAANYQVEERPNFKGLVINGSRYSSIITNKKNILHHMEWVHAQVLEGAPAQDVLVLGAGGFSFSVKNQQHRYLFVDIDPAMKKMSEQLFLPAIQGHFVVSDARAFMLATTRRWDLIFQDINDGEEIPRYLLTQEYFRLIQQKLAPEGFFALTMLHRGSLWEQGGARIARTLQSVFPVCFFTPTAGSSAADPAKTLRQTLALCRKSATLGPLISDDQY